MVFEAKLRLDVQCAGLNKIGLSIYFVFFRSDFFFYTFYSEESFEYEIRRASDTEESWEFREMKISAE